MKQYMKIFKLKAWLSAGLIAMLIGIASPGYSQQNAGKNTVKGTVLDDNDEPLIGATVIVKNTNTGTVTDADGKYTINASDKDVLVFRYLGFTQLEIATGGKSVIDVKMQPDQNLALDEVVVIGYGQVKKKDLTGSVAHVKMADIKDVPVLSVDQALQGRIAGADIMATSGEPGAGTTIRIRGTRSITASNEPLIVVDGVMDGVHDIADINPADIESVNFLKDASSTAIYGTRGSNGVIIITTKQGIDSKPKIVFKGDFGFAQLPRKLDLMNASEFAQFRNDRVLFSTSDGNDQVSINTPQSGYSYPDPFKFGEGTDWVDQLSRTAPYHNYSLSLSGGSQKSSYFASFSFNDTEGIVKQSGIKRYTGRLNLDHQLFDWLKIGFKYNYTYRDTRDNVVGIGGTSYWQNAIFLNPLLAPYADFNPLWGDTGGQRYNSPMHYLNSVESNNIRLFSSNTGYAEAQLVKDLILRNQLTYYTYQRHTYKYQAATLPLSADKGGQANREEYEDLSITNETTLTYRKTLDKRHNLDGVLGFVYSDMKSNNLTLQGIGYLSDALTWNNMGAIPDKQNYTAGTSFGETVNQSFLARFNYNFDNRYYLTMTGRYDGSSVFAANRKWAFFPSAALKWSISNEAFMKDVRWIDETSLRLSAGRTGNTGISRYQSLDALTSSTGGYLFNGAQPVAYYPSRIASPNLTWEKTDMYNVAADIALFKSRIILTAEAYLSYTGDLLLSMATPKQTSFSSHIQNIGKTSNKGVELSIDSRNIVGKRFSWSSTFTISHNEQMVEDIGHKDFISVFNSAGNNPYMMYGYKAGYPLNALWGFKYGGVWKSMEEVNRNTITRSYVSPWSSVPSVPQGLPRYYDIDHNGSLNEHDLIYLGNADPYLYGGLQNNFTYRNFSLNIYFNYSLGGKIYNLSEQYMGNGSPFTNQYRYMLNAWHPVRNPDSDYPRSGNTYLLASDRMVYDASYLRLSTISVGYRLNTAKLTRQAVKDVQLTLSGSNLYLWKYYNGFDPDVSSSGESSTLRRVDNGAYPKSRTVIFSVQLRY
ncbi:MAG: TonB-dependent receptor [Dysgonamonadaceae bacterium]|jgi:TonB-linked SusC/RagA family outer membrane protein|nr:TonB-dependent receptor [Dysgonamonadaceae bacterium]